MSLAQPLPLPSTADWPVFSEAVSIPYGFGRRVSSIGIPLSDRRTSFVWLAGPNGGVDEVKIDGNLAQDWEATSTTDPAGRPATVVYFNRSIDADVVITGRGMLDSSGVLLENPGKVISFLYQLIGRAPTGLDLFTSECARRSVKIQGVLKNGITARAQVSEIMTSVGAIWADSSPDFGIFYPDALLSPSAGKADVGSLTASWSLDDIATQVRVLFAWDAAAERYQGSALLRAPSAIATYGEITREIDAPWLVTASQAVDRGTRELKHVGRPRWRYRTRVPGVVYPGQRVVVDDSAAPRSGLFAVLESRAKLSEEKSTVVLDVLSGAEPYVQVVSTSEAFDDLVTQQDFSIGLEGAEFVIRNEDGDLVPNAQAVLDGGTVRYTDAAGIVVFPSYLLPPGTTHTLVVTKEGQATIAFTFTV